MSGLVKQEPSGAPHRHTGTPAIHGREDVRERERMPDDGTGPLVEALREVQAATEKGLPRALDRLHAVFRDHLLLLNWSRRGAGAQMGLHEKQIRRWVTEGTMPERYAAWLDAWAAYAKANPPPVMDVHYRAEARKNRLEWLDRRRRDGLARRARNRTACPGSPSS